MIMRAKLFILRLLTTILQIAIVPCCIMGDWSERSAGAHGGSGRMNFLDAAVIFDADYAATIVVVIAAAAAVLMIWTKAAPLAVVPSLLQCAIVVKVMTDYLKLSSDGEGNILSFGYMHSGMMIASFILVIIIAVIYKKAAKAS